MVCDHPKPNGTPETPLHDSEAESATSQSSVNEQERDNVRTAGGGGMSGGMRGRQRKLSPPSCKGQAEVKIELASGAMGSDNEQEADFKKLKQIRNRMRRSDWLFLNACAGEKQAPLL